MSRLAHLSLALLLVVAACTAETGSSTTTAGQVEPSTTEADPTTTTGETAPTTTAPASTPTTDPDLSGLEGVSDEVRAQLEDLIVKAQEIRDLPFLKPPIITVVSDDELEARVRADIEEESDDFPADESLYKMLGLLSDTADLEKREEDVVVAGVQL